MGKVLFMGKVPISNKHLDKKVRKSFDYVFVDFDEEKLKHELEVQDISLIVVYLTGIPQESKGELARILHDISTVPFILTGIRDDLHKYFGRTEARVLRYIKTPLLFSEFISEIKRILNQVDQQNIDIEQLYEMESKVIVEKTEPKHILIVDDDPVVLRSISNMLKGLFKVSVVTSGYAALTFLDNEKPDLILLDYQMPVCDGLQTLKMMRSQEALKDIPVFFLTGVNDSQMVKDAISLHPQDYILKSAGMEHLLEKIEHYF